MLFRSENSEVGRVLDEVDVVVAPSIWYENAPLVIREAFLAKKPVVTAAFVLEHPEVVVADVRWYLDGRDGRAAFEQAHLPGAVWVDLDTSLAAHGLRASCSAPHDGPGLPKGLRNAPPGFPNGLLNGLPPGLRNGF